MNLRLANTAAQSRVYQRTTQYRLLHVRTTTPAHFHPIPSQKIVGAIKVAVVVLLGEGEVQR